MLQDWFFSPKNDISALKEQRTAVHKAQSAFSDLYEFEIMEKLPFPLDAISSSQVYNEPLSVWLEWPNMALMKTERNPLNPATEPSNEPAFTG